MSERRPVIELRGVVKTFEDGRVRALDGVELDVAAGEWVAVIGPSGCGKSTLLHLIAALERPDGGTIVVNGEDLAKERDLNHHRSREVGLVFQLDNLISTLSASENIQVPMFETGASPRQRPHESNPDWVTSLQSIETRHSPSLFSHSAERPGFIELTHPRKGASRLHEPARLHSKR